MGRTGRRIGRRTERGNERRTGKGTGRRTRKRTERATEQGRSECLGGSCTKLLGGRIVGALLYRIHIKLILIINLVLLRI